MTLEQINFWKRLESFVKEVQVNDMMSEEEKDMILHTCKEQIASPAPNTSKAHSDEKAKEIFSRHRKVWVEWANKIFGVNDSVEVKAGEWKYIIPAMQEFAASSEIDWKELREVFYVYIHIRHARLDIFY